MKYGTLYGIGVGPGDPDLITLKAVKTLRQVSVVFAAAASENSYSLCVKIASTHLTPHIPVVRLNFPMTRDKRILNAAWDENADRVVHALENGEDAAVLTLGDPMTYSTFGYVMRAVKKTAPMINIRVIPGITSFNAGAASTCTVLAEGDESYTVVAGTLNPERLKEVFLQTNRVVVLKVYRNYRKILDALTELELMDGAVLISRCGLDDELIIENVRDYPDTAPSYLSLLLIKTKANESANA